MNKSLALAALSLCIPLAAHAEANWVEVASNDDVVVSVDTGSLARAGDRVKAWQKWDWSKPNLRPDSNPPIRYMTQMNLVVANCKTGEIALAEAVSYAEASRATVVDTMKVEEASWIFFAVAPGTLGEIARDLACETAKPNGV